MPTSNGRNVMHAGRLLLLLLRSERSRQRSKVHALTRTWRHRWPGKVTLQPARITIGRLTSETSLEPGVRLYQRCSVAALLYGPLVLSIHLSSDGERS